jgi:hypothetical protein
MLRVTGTGSKRGSKAPAPGVIAESSQKYTLRKVALTCCHLTLLGRSSPSATEFFPYLSIACDEKR